MVLGDCVRGERDLSPSSRIQAIMAALFGCASRMSSQLLRHSGACICLRPGHAHLCPLIRGNVVGLAVVPWAQRRLCWRIIWSGPFIFKI